MIAAPRSSPARWLAAVALVAGIAPAMAAAAGSAAAEQATRAANGVMQAFLEAFNARDESAWADTLHFPHVRLASGSVVVYPDRAAFLDAMDLNAFAEQTGWDYSTWDDMEIVQASPQKVHIAVNFTRYDASGEQIASYASFYVVENVDGRWGVRARSSFAP